MQLWRIAYLIHSLRPSKLGEQKVLLGSEDGQILSRCRQSLTWSEECNNFTPKSWPRSSFWSRSASRSRYLHLCSSNFRTRRPDSKFSSTKHFLSPMGIAYQSEHWRDCRIPVHCIWWKVRCRDRIVALFIPKFCNYYQTTRLSVRELHASPWWWACYDCHLTKWWTY